jgi:hypothetical protein
MLRPKDVANIDGYDRQVARPTRKPASCVHPPDPPTPAIVRCCILAPSIAHSWGSARCIDLFPRLQDRPVPLVMCSWRFRVTDKRTRKRCSAEPWRRAEGGRVTPRNYRIRQADSKVTPDAENKQTRDVALLLIYLSDLILLWTSMSLIISLTWSISGVKLRRCVNKMKLTGLVLCQRWLTSWNLNKHVTDHGKTNDHDFDPKGIQTDIRSQNFPQASTDTSI